MPAFSPSQRPGVVWEASSSNGPCPPATTTVYLGVAALAILLLGRLLVRLFRPAPGRQSESGVLEKRPEPQPPRIFPEKQKRPASGAASRPRPQGLRPGPVGGFVPLSTVPSQFTPLKRFPVMDGEQGGTVKEHYRWPEPASSRAVSRSPGTPPYDAPRSGPSSPAPSSGDSGDVGPHSTSVAPYRRCGHAAAASSPSTAHRSTHPMAGVGRPGGDAEPAFSSSEESNQPGLDPSHGRNARIARHFQRPPPPPPLTPPVLSTAAIIPFENRRPSSTVSIPPALDMSFIHQPNPDSGGAYSTSAHAASPDPPSAGPLPRRRSYTRTVPIGMPLPTTSSEPPASASASSPSQLISIPGSSRSSFNSPIFLSSSYPPTARFLPPSPPPPPPPPPGYVPVGGPGGPGVMLAQHEMVNLQGEIVSVVDGSGHGWTRHTRVYGGGGPCLACAAARQRDGDSAGGVYGATVPLEDRRY
ncbi:hypothetical protein VTJ83DRAFT_4062 [Remersonia thermophila]|uniref:Uncharacterized protein n=1 Tax=Remersonia thermophila TaxID=72144 RepID=A0ABR4DFW3_9PEZI